MKKNILANLIGRSWSVLSNFLFIPLYISILGIESYSIISFTIVLNGLLTLLDAGLTATLSREFSSSQNDSVERIKIFKTLESSYFILSFLAIVLLVLSSGFIAKHWLNLGDSDPENVTIFLKIIGFEVGFRLLANFYNGGFIGLDRQVKSNVYFTTYSILRNGLVLIPIYFYPSLYLFFLWQALSTILFVVLIRLDLGFILTKSFKIFYSKPVIEKQILSKVWKFAGGMMLISMVAGLNTQMDKLALSKLLPIEILGLYTLAFALSNILNVVSTPISVALLPKMTNLFTAGNKSEAIKIFNIGHILVSIIVFSLSAILIIYPQELLWIWTNDLTLSKKVMAYLPWITIGMAFLALQLLPFNVAISNGYTKFNNYIGLTSLFITMPGYWIMVEIYGGIGAAITFSIVQITSGIIFIYLINKRFLQIELKTIVLKYYLVPFLISFTVVLLFQHFINIESIRLIMLIKISFIIIFSIAINIIIILPLSYVINEIRKTIRYFKKLKI